MVCNRSIFPFLCVAEGGEPKFGRATSISGLSRCVTLVGGMRLRQNLGERTSHGLPFGHGIEAVKVDLKCGSLRFGRNKKISEG
jgi:hypothetical protein